MPILAILSLIGSACGEDSQPQSQQAPEAAQGSTGVARVAMRELRFVPEAITVRRGQPIEWRNEDPIQHNAVVAGQGEGPRSELFGEGETYRFVPRRAGRIAYVCTIHPGMEGTITVRG